jgi:hypothetical protein
MTSIPPIVDEAEGFLRELATDFTRPHPNECLCCYVGRMLDEFPCDGSHRHAFRYRDIMAPRATALAESLRRIGACCCDCELFLNGYRLRTAPASYGYSIDDVAEPEPEPEPLPPCNGVRRGSVRPCDNWVRTGGR